MASWADESQRRSLCCAGATAHMIGPMRTISAAGSAHARVVAAAWRRCWFAAELLDALGVYTHILPELGGIGWLAMVVLVCLHL